MLFVAPGGRARTYCPEVCFARLLTSPPLSYSVYGLVVTHVASRRLRPSNVAVARTRRRHVLRPTATGKPRAPRNRSIDSACEARRAPRRAAPVVRLRAFASEEIFTARNANVRVPSVHHGDIYVIVGFTSNSPLSCLSPLV